MTFSIWAILTWIVLPLGCVVVALILSGLQPLVWLGIRVSKIEIQLGFIVIKLPLLLSFLSGMCVVAEWLALERLKRLKMIALSSNVLGVDYAWKANLWRHQRNWWLSLSSLALWLVVWRLSVLIELQKQRLTTLSHSRSQRCANGSTTKLQ